MSYLFARARRGTKKPEEDSNSSQENGDSIIEKAVETVLSSSIGSSSEDLSPGNSPGEGATATRRPFGFRRILSDYWFQEKKGSDEKYYPLTSNSEDNLATSMDVLDGSESGSHSSADDIKVWKRKEEELNIRMQDLESDLKNCQLENQMLTIMVEDLVKLQETHQAQIDNIKQFFEDKIADINTSHEAMINELILSNQKQVEDFISSHEGLVEDLINSHEQQIREWKIAFAADVENTPELKDENAVVGLPAKIWVKFSGLSELSKGLVVVGIGILGSVVGLTSWRFVFWAWPKLVAFASTIEAADVLNIIGWLSLFIKSAGYQKFVESWESGEPITKETIKDIGTDVLGFAITHLGPSLLSQGRSSSKKLQITAGSPTNNDMQF